MTSHLSKNVLRGFGLMMKLLSSSKFWPLGGTVRLNQHVAVQLQRLDSRMRELVETNSCYFYVLSVVQCWKPSKDCMIDVENVSM